MLRWNSTGITIAGSSGIPGNTSDRLDTPFDVTFDRAGDLYIVDRMNYRVQKYTTGTSIIRTVAGNGTRGTSATQLHYPSRVIIDSNENFYVSDTGNNRIQLWRYGTNFGETIAGVTSKENESRSDF